MSELQQWLDSAEYLPPPLRDFHDQKDVFKAMHEIIDVDEHEYAKSVNWRDGQCYVIDIFLWFMARRGYTLQRSRKRLPFRDLDSDVSKADEQRQAHFAALLNPRPDGTKEKK